MENSESKKSNEKRRKFNDDNKQFRDIYLNNNVNAPQSPVFENAFIEQPPAPSQVRYVDFAQHAVIREKFSGTNHFVQDAHMSAFTSLLLAYTDYQPQDVTYLGAAMVYIEPRQGRNLQILYDSGGVYNDPSHIGHWICSYFDCTRVHIYDSLNGRALSHDQYEYLARLYGENVADRPIFHRVQSQLNGMDYSPRTVVFMQWLLPHQYVMEETLNEKITTELY